MKIPRSLFKEGIDLCKKNILDYLTEAKIIAQKAFLPHAYVLVQFAIEELGKIKLLQDKLEESNNDPVEIHFKKEFGNHEVKHKKALEMLGKTSLWIRKGPFNPATLNHKTFDVGKEASPETKLSFSYVGFSEKRQKWYIGGEVSKSDLYALIQEIEETTLAL